MVWSILFNQNVDVIEGTDLPGNRLIVDIKGLLIECLQSWVRLIDDEDDPIIA